MGEGGYKLDLLSPVRHVATEMEKAAPAALSIEEMAATYRHPNPGDLTRVKMHEGRANDSEATTWLIHKAIDALRTRGQSGKGQAQIVGDTRSGYRFAASVTFDDLRYDRKKLHRTGGNADEEERQALRAVYSDLNAERPFYVTTVGPGGGKKDKRLWLHPLAHAIPQVSEKEFFELAADIKRHGVRNPITIFDGRVLDGRHRLAIAAALKAPLRTVDFSGDATAARDEVISQNVQRRHLTMAQRGLIVQELFLPQAEAEAKTRQEEHGGTAPNTPRQLAQSESARAVDQAAAESNGLASPRTLQRMAPVRDAPKTQERIRSGEIKTSTEARREALKEIGSDEPEDVPALRPFSAYDNLGRARGVVAAACAAIERGDLGKTDGVPEEKLIGRINEIRDLLDHAEGLLTAGE